jgi:hypothetical protein
LTVDPYEYSRSLQRKMNPESLAWIREHGVLLGTIICITNVFYAPSKAVTDSLEEVLRIHEFRNINGSLDSSREKSISWCIEADDDYALDVSILDRMTDLCVDIAEQCHAEYDGWFTEVQPSDPK